MRKIFLIIALVIIANVSKAGDNPQVIKIKTSAVCGMCKRKIEKNLAYEKGIVDVNLDIPSKIVTISFDPKKTDLNTIKKIINNAGYDADTAIAPAEAYDKLPSCCKKTEATHQ